MIKELTNDLLENQRGSSIVILAIAMTMVIGMLALVADIGVNYVVQAKLSVAADAAAMAGGTKLREGYDRIVQTAVNMAGKNGVSADKVMVSVDQNNSGVKVTTKAPISLFFAKIFGTQSGEMAQSAHVVAARPVGIYRMFPVGIDHNFVFTFGETYKLFAKKGDYDELDLGSGNSGALELTESASGASDFEYYLSHGFPELVSVGDVVWTKSGVKYSSIKGSLDYRLDAAEAEGHNCSPSTCPADCPRILYIPVYKPIWENNKVVRVEIMDFAAFWIDAQKKSNGEWDISKEISGIFIKITKGGFITEVGDSPYGITSGKLIE